MTSSIERRAQVLGVPWWAVLIQGLASIFFGAVFLFSPGVTFFVVIQLLGIYWLISGLLALVSLIFNRSRLAGKLASGILGIVGGLIVLSYPVLATVITATSLAIVLAVAGILIGVIGIVRALQGEGWGMGILGALSVVVGILVLTDLWFVAFSLPVVIGAVAVVGGILSIFAAFRMKASHVQSEGDEISKEA